MTAKLIDSRPNNDNSHNYSYAASQLGYDSSMSVDGSQTSCAIHWWEDTLNLPPSSIIKHPWFWFLPPPNHLSLPLSFVDFGIANIVVKLVVI
jgi:hypothetical protein